MGEKKLVRPFEIHATIEGPGIQNPAKVEGKTEPETIESGMPMDTLAIIEQAKRDGINTENLEKPFTRQETKMYLILSEYSEVDTDEQISHDWEIFYGTTQELYDKLKIMIEDESMHYDVMKSRLLVNGETARLKTNVSVYHFMSMQIERGNAVDETGFDISDYYYELSEEEEAFYHGEETR